MQGQSTNAARRNAKALRKGMTDAEQLGVKFRRQHPLGPCVLDFACLDPKIVIEVDGSQHLDQIAYDERRSAWLATQGDGVLRFYANDVLAQTDVVVLAIINRLNELRGRASALAPTPALPHSGRESTKDIV